MGKLNRRQFLKLALLTAGGTTAAALGVPYIVGERIRFDPNDSYWVGEQPSGSSRLQEDINVDVAIIGGGFTGLSAAYHLANQNPKASIVVLEARQVGHGASGRNGGMVLPQTGPESMAIDYDRWVHKLTYDLTIESMAELESLVKATGIDCDLNLGGYYHTITRLDYIEYYEEYVNKVTALGMPLALLDRKEVAAELGTEVYYGAVYDPNGGHLHPMKLIHALKSAAGNAGVAFFENSPVHEIIEGELIHLSVGEQSHQIVARDIVLATNGYTSKLGYFRNQVIPVHSQCAATPPLDESLVAELGWTSRLPFYDSNYLLYHLILTEDNRIVIGGGNAEYVYNNGVHYRGDLDEVAEMLRGELIRIYPALADIQFEYVWNGILGVSYDEYEAVGVTGKHKNIYYGLAYNGHGINLSFLFGKIVAALYRKDWRATAKWEEMSFLEYPLPNFPPDPLKWMGAKGLVDYYRKLDRWG